MIILKIHLMKWASDGPKKKNLQRASSDLEV